MANTTYSIRWNPDSRWNYGHWTVTRKSQGCTSFYHKTYFSDAIAHPLNMKDKYPDSTDVVLPSYESKEKARRYYGAILNEMFNVTEGEFIGS